LKVCGALRRHGLWRNEISGFTALTWPVRAPKDKTTLLKEKRKQNKTNKRKEKEKRFVLCFCFVFFLFRVVSLGETHGRLGNQPSDQDKERRLSTADAFRAVFVRLGLGWFLKNVVFY
jgi:hypothetical protein